MLILTRKKGQGFLINDNIRVTIKETGSDTVRIAIDAPKDVKILRDELVEAAEMNEAAAAQQTVAATDVLRAFAMSTKK